MLSFIPKKLDTSGVNGYGASVPSNSPTRGRSAAHVVRKRVEGGGARFWKHSDFQGLPPAAVAMALSRLEREGALQRMRKGVYYRAAPTTFGPSIPAASAIAAQTLGAPLHPAGLTAASALGLTTQNPRRLEYATPAPAAPRALGDALVHTGRSVRRTELSAEEGAILEVLRERARSSDLSPEETTQRLLRLLQDEERFRRVTHAALAEPPRVRAMLGALGEELRMPPKLLSRLRKSLNPLSRYDFGQLASLPNAKDWQAK